MVNRPKAKGTAAETLVVQYLRENGWPYAERRALAGAVDLGDVTGCPGLVWEVKAGSVIKMAEWLQETREERENAKADHGILVIKPARVGARNMSKWLAVMDNTDLHQLVQKFDIESLRQLVQYDGPAAYSKTKMVEDLRVFGASSPAGCVPVLLRRAPGTTEQWDAWYAITYLNDMITCLRAAGYGTPLLSVSGS